MWIVRGHDARSFQTQNEDEQGAQEPGDKQAHLNLILVPASSKGGTIDYPFYSRLHYLRF